MRTLCPVCDGKKQKAVYTQKFASGLTHRIVHCPVCDLYFVTNTKPLAFFHAMYTKGSKYEITRDDDIHECIAKRVKKHFAKGDRIMDVGCGTGNLLSKLKKAGFTNIVGMDPSPLCKKVAAKEFGVKVITSTIEVYKGDKKKYKLIMFNSVLEHLVDPKSVIEKIAKHIADDGYLFLTVPDIDNTQYDVKEPYAEFSTEHINFFSRRSLHILLKQFTSVEITYENGNMYSLWKKGGVESSFDAYLHISEEKQKQLVTFINTLPKGILVWGAGSLTQRLLLTTKLAPSFLIDRDPHVAGTKIRGVSVITPDDVKKYPKTPILVSSWRFKESIVSQLKSMNVKNRIYLFP